MMVAAFYATPYVVGYTMAWTGTGRIGSVVIMTAWIWTTLYWGMVVHAKQVTRLIDKVDHDDTI